MEELIERGELGKAQRKHLYHGLPLRVANENHLTGKPPSGADLRGLIEAEKANETEVEGSRGSLVFPIKRLRRAPGFLRFPRLEIVQLGRRRQS